MLKLYLIIFLFNLRPGETKEDSLGSGKGSNIDSVTIKTIGYLHLDVFIVI